MSYNITIDKSSLIVGLGNNQWVKFEDYGERISINLINASKLTHDADCVEHTCYVNKDVLERAMTTWAKLKEK